MADKKSSMKALAATLRALADAIESEDAPDGKPAAAAKKKDAAAGAAAAATTGAGNGGAPADVANRTSAAAGTGAPTGGDIMAQCRQAAKSYAEVYGREGLKEVLGKYTQGTLADVAADRLPDLLKELS